MKNNNFFRDINIKGTYIQVGEVNNIFVPNAPSNIDEYLMKNKNKDLYFCANVDKVAYTKDGRAKDMLSRRASDHNITYKKYIYFDFDIRNSLLEKGVSVTDEEIKKIGINMINELKKDRIFSKWSYLVFSGNGLHLYYISDNESGVKVYQEFYGVGYDVFCKRLKKVCGYTPDRACKNIARLARIPGSYNNKHESKLVEIILENGSRSNIIELVHGAGVKEMERRQDVHSFEIKLMDIKKREFLYSIDEVISKINSLSIVDEVLKDYPNWVYDGEKHFTDVSGKSVTSAFIHNNLLIISDSRWFSEIDYKGCGTYLYRRERSGMTNRQAIEYFKENYNLKT